MIHKTHFVQVAMGVEDPMDFRVTVITREYVTIVARLPGSRDDEFEADRKRLQGAMFGHRIPGRYADILVRSRPKRQEMAAIEQEIGATCVVFDRYGQRPPYNQVTQTVIDECEVRLGRPLKKKERRDISKQIDPQIREARSWFLERGWGTHGHRILPTGARLVAGRLLDPERSWPDIVGHPLTDPLLGSIRRVARTFAQRAGVTLPTPSPGPPHVKRPR